MPLSDEDRATIEEYRAWLEASLTSEESVGSVERADREDESALASRFRIGENVWLELAVRPAALQLQASILTDDRWLSEEMEDAIRDSGDTMQEFVEMGFEEAGLDWEEPPVLHYREAGKHFYFSTPLDIGSMPALKEEALRVKSRQMVLGYRHAFGPILTKAK